MKKSLISIVLLFLALPAVASAASFELSTDKIFAPGEPVTVTVSAMDVPTLDIRLYRIDDPKSYFLGLEDVHSPAVETRRDVSAPSEMVGAVKRKAGRLLRDDYRGKLTDNIRNDLVAALGLPHASEPTAPPPESYELFPILKRFTLIDRRQENLVIKRSGGWQYHTINMDVPGIGCYLVEAVYEDEVAYTVVVVTSMSFVVKNSYSDSLIYVADRVSGKPMRGVKVSVYDQEKNLLFKGRTDSEGTYYSKMKSGDSNTIYVFAEDGKNFTLADPYAYWWDSADDKVYTYTDRPVYRPGDTVYFRSILRESTDSGLEVPDTGDSYPVIINDAKGNEIFRDELSMTEYGSLSGSFVLGAEPSLGEYQIVVGLNGQNYYSRFKVEEYKKPEYEVKVSTDKGVYIRGETIRADVDAGYYFGSPVSGAAVDYTVYRSVYERPWWWGYDWGWYFMDSDYYYTHEKVMVDSGTATLDENGKLKITVDTAKYLESPEKDYMFTIEASVTDLSRRVVTTSSVVKVVRAAYSVTVRPDRWLYTPGDTARVTVNVSDFDNKGVAGVPVSLIVTVTDWKTDTVVASTTLAGVTNAGGDAVIEYPVKNVGDIAFSATVFDTAGNSTSARDSSYSLTRDYGYRGDSGGGVSIVPDKDTYAVGDTAHILIAAPVENTYLLVTTEGDSIYDSRVIKIDAGSTMLDLPITERYTPNIYVSVSAIFNDELYSESKNIIIPPTAKFVNVEVISDKAVYEPQEKGTFTIKTTDDKGKPVSAEVSLGVVDDAIYAISPELVDEIQKYFYSLRYHSVDTSSSLYFRFYGYSHRKGLLAGLPDSETTLADFKGDSLVEPEIRRDFKDTMYWSPTITTGRDGTATVEVTFPDNLTRWRATVRGITSGDSMGQVTYTVISRKDLLVRIEAPRFLRQGDDLVISTIAHNYLSTDKNVHFTFEATGLKLVSGKPVDAVVPKNGEKRIDWHVRADLVGDAVLTAKAMTNEVSDGMELTIPVLPMGIKETQNDVGEIVKESGTLTITVTKPPTTIKNAAELVLTTTPTLSGTLLSAIPYLVGYPYGCNEQVMSRFLPSVMVASMLKKLDLGMNMEGIQKDLPDYINSGLMVLYKRQHDDNGWGWYEFDETDQYMTAYVLYGLLEAKRLLPEAGIPITVDEGVIKRGTASLIAQLPSIKDDSVRIYALYVLSYTDKLKLTWLDEMFEKRDKLTAISKAMLLLAYENAGVESKARTLYDDLMKEKIEENGYVHWGYTGQEFYWWDWQADPLETTAYMLRVMAGRDIESPLIPKTIRWLIANRTGCYWMSTKATGKVIYAMSDYLERTGETAPDYTMTVSLNGTQIEKTRITKGTTSSGDGVLTIPEADLKVGPNTITITKDGPGSLYYSSAFTCYTKADRIESKDSGFDVKRKYYLLKRTAKKGELVYAKVPLSGPVTSGDEILVELSVTSDKPVKYFLLEDNYPAGFEAVTDDENYIIAGDDLYTGHWWWWYSGREYRDERIAITMNYFPKGTETFKYILRAQNPGTYEVMPADAYLMYFPNRSGRSGGTTMVITDTP